MLTTSWASLPAPADSTLLLDRAGHSATAVGRHIYVFGGRRGSHFYGDLLLFDTHSRVWTSPAAPCPFSPRANHTATLVGSTIWFVGGCDADEVFGDVFCLDTATHAWSSAPMLCVLPAPPHCSPACGWQLLQLQPHAVYRQARLERVLFSPLSPPPPLPSPPETRLAGWFAQHMLLTCTHVAQRQS